MAIELGFWLMAGALAYAYVGYPILILTLRALRNRPRPDADQPPNDNLPCVTLVVAAYNEEAWLQNKIDNALALDYPGDKLKIMIVTDGSDDHSEAIIAAYPDVVHLHQPVRRGKMAAINRAMPFVETDLVIFSDANTILNRQAARELTRLFSDPTVGCVGGEKRLYSGDVNDAAGAGEGAYWRYESAIKAAEADLGSCVGAVGELFAIRASLFRPLPDDTLVDDFMISMTIALQGYRIAYAPNAYASESASANIQEEFKRKVRIAAGNVQAIQRLPALLNPAKNGMLAFQYFSHKFLRSILAPLIFIAVFGLNIPLVAHGPHYGGLLAAQIGFYLVAGIGFLLRERRIGSKLVFVPFYIVVMNLSSLIGTYRQLLGRQSVVWAKARRKDEQPETETQS
jgi:cellulose synthase/poly-beta-1,6-N-acetylglucosamine synthase-like glycosyltransferase